MPDAVAQKTAGEQRSEKAQRVGRHDPLQGSVARMDAAAEVRQCDVHHGGVDVEQSHSSSKSPHSCPPFRTGSP